MIVTANLEKLWSRELTISPSTDDLLVGKLDWNEGV